MHVFVAECRRHIYRHLKNITRSRCCLHSFQFASPCNRQWISPLSLTLFTSFVHVIFWRHPYVAFPLHPLNMCLLEGRTGSGGSAIPHCIIKQACSGAESFDSLTTVSLAKHRLAHEHKQRLPLANFAWQLPKTAWDLTWLIQLV